MTERSIGESVAINKARREMGVAEGVVMSRRSGFLADYLINSGSTDKTKRGEASERTRGIFVSLRNQLGLRQDVFLNADRLRLIAEEQVKNATPSQVEMAKEMWVSVVDGVAMAICRPGLSPELRRAINQGDGVKIRKFLVTRGMESLVGSERAMIASAIRDGKILEMIGRYDELLESRAMVCTEVEDMMFAEAQEMFKKNDPSIDKKDLFGLMAYLNGRVQLRESRVVEVDSSYHPPDDLESYIDHTSLRQYEGKIVRIEGGRRDEFVEGPGKTRRGLIW